MAERLRHCAQQQGHCRNFRRGGEERRHRRRRALVDVWCPHVEGRRRDLEREADDHEHHADDGPRRGLGGRGQRSGQSGEIHRAGEAVNQRDAVEQQPGGKRAEHEILEPGLGRAQLVAGEGGEHVLRQRLQLERKIKRDQVGGRRHAHHADHAKQHQYRELEARDIVLAIVVERQNERKCRAHQHQNLDEDGELIDGELAKIPGPADPRHRQKPGEEERAKHEHGADLRLVAFAQHAIDQDQHAENGEHDLRRRDGPVHGRVPCGALSLAVAAASIVRCAGAAIAWRCCATMDVTVASQKRVKLDG